MGLFSKLRGKKQELVAPVEPPSEAAIQEWLVTHIADVAQVEPADVDLDRPFAEFGMDSMQLFELSGDLQKFLGHEVSEIVAWDFPTIAKLSKHLSSPGSEVPVSASMTSQEEIPGVDLSDGVTEPQR